MPPVTRQGDLCTGHDACPPRPAIGGDPTVTVCGRPVMREGDAYAVHGCLLHSSHGAVLAAGAAAFTVSGANIGRIGDSVSCGGSAAQGEGTVTIGNKGGTEAGRKLAFAMLRSEQDRLIQRLPDIAVAEQARANARDRVGWIHFNALITKWLHGKAHTIAGNEAGAQPPYFVDWEWLMQYKRFERAARTLLQPDYLFEPAALAKLASVLEKSGAFSGTGQTFDHSALSWDKQREHAFQGKPMDFAIIGSPVEENPIKPDGLQTVVGNVTLYALASGRTSVTPSGEKQILVERVSFFIYDGFEFVGDQWLGNWTCTEEDKFVSGVIGTPLFNRDFREFREKTGFGCDFRTMTIPKLVWTGEYVYAVN